MVSMDSGVPELQGRRGPSKGATWMIAPLVIFGTLRLAMMVAQEFSKSPGHGARALLNIGIALLCIIIFVALIVLIQEAIFLARARNASGTKDLMLMNLSVDSYQQAYDVKGKVVFLPKWDQGVYLEICHYALALYAGFKKSTGPRMWIAFADISSIKRKEVRIFGGTTPGLVIETDSGPFELGFVNSSAIRLGRIRKRVAEERYQRIESAWARWVDSEQR